MIYRTKRSQPKQKKSIAGNVSRLTIHTCISPTPMTQSEWEACEDLLAEMVARAIWADHQRQTMEVEND